MQKDHLTVGKYSGLTYEISELLEVQRYADGYFLMPSISTVASWRERDEASSGTIKVLHADVSVLGKRSSWIELGRAAPCLAEQATIALNDGSSGVVLLRLPLTPHGFEVMDLAREGDDLTLRFQFSFELTGWWRFGTGHLVSAVPQTRMQPQMQRTFAASTWAKILEKAGTHSRFLLEVPAVVPAHDAPLRQVYEIFRSAQSAAGSGDYRACRSKCQSALVILARLLGDEDVLAQLDTSDRPRKAQRLRVVRAALLQYSDASGPRPDGDFDQDDAYGMLLMVGGLLRTVGKLPPT